MMTAQEARELFRVDQGVLINRIRRGPTAAPDMPAGGFDGFGYIRVRVGGIRYKAHRLVWLIHYGSWPTQQIDHINGIRHDNRIENLRDVSCQDNQRNQRLRADNSTGVAGVSISPYGWVARIKLDGSNRYLGSFRSKGEAVAARKAAEKLYGFHENHGLRTA